MAKKEPSKAPAIVAFDLMKIEVADVKKENRRLYKWIKDMQSKQYVNCVYCGHRYPPGTPDVRDNLLYAHIKKCPKHPLKKAFDLMRSMMICLEAILEDESGVDNYNIRNLLKQGKEMLK
jgi:hypothetical protein